MSVSDKPEVVNDLLSELGQKFREEWTAAQCIEELRRVGLLAHDNGSFLSRQFFRNHSVISGATWERYFGTMEEFRRQAGIELPRGAHRVALNVAKHAAKDVYRAMNIDKAGWEDKFQSPCNKRFQTILGGNDLHDIECDPFWRRVFIDTANRVQPEKIVLNGDVLDLPEFGKYSVDPRTFDPMARIRWLHSFLGELRTACPNSEIVLIEGNHEHRFLRHLADAGVAGATIKVILNDLHGMSVADFFGLTAHGVNYIARTDLAAENIHDIKKELRKNYAVFYDTVLACHYPDALGMQMPGWNGHHHSHRSESRFNPVFGTHEWHQFGGGHVRWATYTNGEKWSNGFGLIHVDTHKKLTQIEYVDTTAGFCVIGGKWYERHISESILNKAA